MMQARLLLPILALFAVGGSAMSGAAAPAAAARRGGECFNVRTVDSFSSAGRDAINVRIGVSRYYRLDILGTCPDIDFSFRVALRSRSGSSWICNPTDAEVYTRGPTGIESCPVVAMRPLSDQEVAAIRHPPRRHH